MPVKLLQRARITGISAPEAGARGSAPHKATTALPTGSAVPSLLS